MFFLIYLASSNLHKFDPRFRILELITFNFDEQIFNYKEYTCVNNIILIVTAKSNFDMICWRKERKGSGS